MCCFSFSGVGVKSTLKCGVCVSCGRVSQNFNRVCPYCGEMVWQPRLLGILRWATLTLPFVLCLWIAVCRGHDFRAWSRAFVEIPRWGRFTYACGIAVMLLPANDLKQVVASTRALWSFQANALIIGLMICAPIMWVSVFLKTICVTPIDIASVLATVLLCCCGIFLRRGVDVRFYLAANFFLFTGVFRILL